MARVLLSLGSNLGNREHFLDQAIQALAALPGTEILRLAGRYETSPVDVPAEFEHLRFLNSALLLETSLPPNTLLCALHRIEADLGRIRTVTNGPRTLDLDIIAYEGIVSNTPTLTLPHPRAHLRAFVLQPAAELGFSASMIRHNCFPSAANVVSPASDSSSQLFP